MKKVRKVPQFRSREEEAAFWDSHSIASYIREMEPVEVEVKKPLTHVLSVRVDREDLRKLDALAQTLGVGITTMARMLIKGALRKPGFQRSLRASETEAVQRDGP